MYLTLHLASGLDVNSIYVFVFANHLHSSKLLGVLYLVHTLYFSFIKLNSPRSTLQTKSKQADYAEDDFEIVENIKK